MCFGSSAEHMPEQVAGSGVIQRLPGCLCRSHPVVHTLTCITSLVQNQETVADQISMHHGRAATCFIQHCICMSSVCRKHLELFALRQARSACICCTCVGGHSIEVVHSSCQLQQTAGLPGQCNDSMPILTTPASAADTCVSQTSTLN